MNLNWSESFINDNKKIKKEFITPIIIKQDSDYFSNLKSLFCFIKEELYKTCPIKEYLDICEEYEKKLIECVQRYYEGDIIKAHRCIDSIIQEFIKDGIAISKITNSISFNDPDIIKGGRYPLLSEMQFFRARISDNMDDFEANEMLHIPFNQRGKVRNQRFSIAGLPCLYFGSTSYCCWLEMRKPDDYKFNVSHIMFNKDFKILNLTINSHILLDLICQFESYGKATQKSKTIFKLWILTLVTSFKIKDDNRTFKSEYIIPQMIMLACKKSRVDGVAYFSKQMKDDKFAIRIGVNLALFTRYSGEEKYSRLCNNFYVSNSYNYSMFKQLTSVAKWKKQAIHIDNSCMKRNIGDYDTQFKYSETEFYNFDKFLISNLPYKKIDTCKYNE